MNKVLLIPANHRVLELSNLLSEKNDFEILTAINVEDALLKMGDSLPHLIVIDVDAGEQIPQMVKKYPSIPCLTLGPKISSPDVLPKIRQTGALNYLNFPLDKVEVFSQIFAALEISKLYQEIKAREKALEDLRHEQLDLMGIVAHDLKSPLNKVMGLIQLMPLVGQLNEEQQSYIELINKVIAGGRKLIDDILTINEVEDHLQPLQMEEIDLREFVEDILESYHSQADEKEIKLHFKSPAQIYLDTDRDSLARILDNLLSNAIKFTHTGKNVYISLQESSGFVSISVRDEGQGISQADQQKMFKKFQKLSAKPTANETSTGLGLSIIKTLVEKLKGEIKFKSEVGLGTEFSVVFAKSKR
jgi:signal transduction histidine kinase